MKECIRKTVLELLEKNQQSREGAKLMAEFKRKGTLSKREVKVLMNLDPAADNASTAA